jgi:hypothetical protein
VALLATFLLTPFRRIRPNPGLETPGAVRTYNFNIAVDPNLLWKDLGLKPAYPTIYEGIPAVTTESGNLGMLINQ